MMAFFEAERVVVVWQLLPSLLSFKREPFCCFFFEGSLLLRVASSDRLRRLLLDLSIIFEDSLRGHLYPPRSKFQALLLAS